MKDETRQKIHVTWERIKCEVLPPIAAGSILGMIVGGYFGTIGNSAKINRLEKRVDNHSKLINQHADAGNNLVERCRETDEKLEELQRKQELLMENALRITEGRR